MDLEYNRREEGAAWGPGEGGVMGEGGGREERGSGSTAHIFSGRPPRGRRRTTSPICFRSCITIISRRRNNPGVLRVVKILQHGL